MRGQHHVRCEHVRKRRQRAGVGHYRQPGGRSASRARANCSWSCGPMPEPTSQAWTRFSGHGSGAAHHLGAGLADQVAPLPAGRGTGPCPRRRPVRRGTPGRQRPGSARSLPPRPAPRASTFARAGRGAGKRPASSALLEPAQRRRGKVFFNADGHHVTRPAWSAPGSASRPALAPPNVTVRSAGSTGPAASPGVRVDAAGEVAGHHEAVRRQRRAPHGRPAPRSAALPRSPPLAPVPRTASMTTSARGGLRGQSGECRFGESVHARPPARSNAASAAGWAASPVRTVVVRIPAGGEEGGGVEAVAAVVAFAGEHHHWPRRGGARVNAVRGRPRWRGRGRRAA